MIHKHVLEGCSPTPLAFYLKALGILRLVSQQKDRNCRGAWIDDRFVLATTLTREELETFFLEEYKPTAIIDPWNGGSGFYPKDNSKAIDSIIVTTDSRLKPLRDAILLAREMVGTRKESPSDDEKVDMQATCLMEARGTTLDAIRAAYSLAPIAGKQESKASYPSLLGTGWNDGRLDFANNFHQRIAELFGLMRKPDKTAQKEEAAVLRWSEERHSVLRLALWCEASGFLKKSAIGQFLPGSAGGANSTTGADGDSLVNPWDYVLMLEGAILFTATATKRMNPQATTQASAPFSLHNQATGGATLSDREESQRGEQWMPLWERFLGCQELQTLLSEGRAQIGRVTASRPVDMARAISRLGVSRGIRSFQRFGYLERNGQANFAVPLERIDVQERPRTRLIDEIAPWMDRLHRLARDKAPARLVQAERNLADAVFATLTHDDSPQRWQDILLAAVEIESLQATGTAIQCGPIPRLSPDWIQACLGESHGPEERLAVALGSAAAGYSHDGWGFDRIRHHWLPLQKVGDRFETTDAGKRLSHDVRVVAHSHNAVDDLLAVMARRAMESNQKEKRHPQLVAAKGAEAHLSDIAAWIQGSEDAERCVNLARAFMAVDWKRWVQEGHRVSRPAPHDLPDDAWCALKLNALPYAVEEYDIPLDPAILRRLEIGDGAEALRLALRRLQAHGIRPALSEALIDPDLARRYGSALAFPLAYETTHNLLQQIQPNPKETRHVH